MTSEQQRPPVWDSGLQAERTSLSWQRVNLAGLASGLVSARLLVESYPLIGYALAVLSAVGALLAYLSPWIAPLVGIGASAIVYIVLLKLSRQPAVLPTVQEPL